MRTEPMSQNLRDFLDLWRRFTAAKEAGQDMTEWRRQATIALQILFPPIPDTDPRLWKKCLTCDDTGYEMLTRYPAIYGGKTPIRFAVPCRCATGESRRQTIALYEAPG